MAQKIEKTLKDHLRIFIILLVLIAIVFSFFSKGPFKFDVEKISGSAIKENASGEKPSLSNTIFHFAILIGCVLAFFYRNQISYIFLEKGNPNKKLTFYVRSARKKGFSDRKIKKRLVEEGWDIIDIDTALSKAKTRQ